LSSPQAEFGKQDFSLKSGRSDAFTWPTIGRVGDEAFRMAAQRLGTEGSTGISSPKRYLWDDQPYSPGWRFSQAFVKSDVNRSPPQHPCCTCLTTRASC
jgi:hypothetical protein